MKCEIYKKVTGTTVQDSKFPAQLAVFRCDRCGNLVLRHVPSAPVVCPWCMRRSGDEG